MRDHDYIVDITGLKPGPSGTQSGEPASLDASPAPNIAATHGRPWLAILWRCCTTYGRIYRSRSGKSYQGSCPSCGKPLRIGIAPKGDSGRFFEAC